MHTMLANPYPQGVKRHLKHYILFFFFWYFGENLTGPGHKPVGSHTSPVNRRYQVQMTPFPIVITLPFFL